MLLSKSGWMDVRVCCSMDLIKVWAKLWWLAFQAAAIFILSIHSVLSRLHCAAFGHASSASPSPAKRPQVVGVVLGSHEAQHQKHQIVELVHWLADIGVRYVSLYDFEGVLKSDIQILQNSLQKQLGEKWRIHCFHHKQVLPWDKEEDLGMNSTGFDLGRFPTRVTEGSNSQENQNNDLHLVTVEVLSHSDGKEAIVMAAKFLCVSALQAESCSKLAEDDINDSLKAIGSAGPDPHLLLLCSNTNCFLGFPPWRLKLTEILHMGSLKNMTQQSFIKALDAYSKKEQRCGK